MGRTMKTVFFLHHNLLNSNYGAIDFF